MLKISFSGGRGRDPAHCCLHWWPCPQWHVHDVFSSRVSAYRWYLTRGAFLVTGTGKTLPLSQRTPGVDGEERPYGRILLSGSESGNRVSTWAVMREIAGVGHRWGSATDRVRLLRSV
ncbi:hypothetical protein CDAR_375561 [Caerostris darwini]|uniref:Uncharacterized protein n=1 Tax=Caerostris darwini TaxID=1538125 RepID=A0AAV4S3Z3_9ARAC|nr:hypothetical protein CDAR_375561 [Caerostris darwini]